MRVLTKCTTYPMATCFTLQIEEISLKWNELFSEQSIYILRFQLGTLRKMSDTMPIKIHAIKTVLPIFSKQPKMASIQIINENKYV